MAVKILTKRYAQAVFEIARDTDDIEKWRTELARLTELSQDVELLAILESPKVSFENKTRVVDEQVKEISQMARNLAYLLITRNKISAIGSIAEQYEQLLDGYHGIKHAEVTTAVPLDDTEKSKVESTLENLMGTKIVLTTKVDPVIVGGMIARINGKLLDGSTSTKLLALKNELVGAGK